MQGYFTYIIKTWLATMVATPFVFAPLFYLVDPVTAAEFSFFQIVILLIFLGFAVSIPSLLLLGLVSRYLEKIIGDTRRLKLITILFSIALIILSFIFFFGGIESDEVLLVVVLAATYVVAILGFGFYFKIKASKYPRSF